MELDVRCPDSVSRIVADFRPHVIFHLAASFSTDLGESYASNVLGAHNLLSSLGATGLDTRLLLIGSAAEYGQIYPSENPVTDRQPLRPMTIYGLTKTWQTQLGLMRANQGADVVVARLFNLYADGLSDRLFVGRIQRQIAALQAGNRAVIEVGNLDTIRDYVTADDAVDQLLAIATCGARGNIYHVASGQPIRMRELLLNMLREQGISASVVLENSPTSTHHGYDVPTAFADVATTSALLKQWRNRVED